MRPALLVAVLGAAACEPAPEGSIDALVADLEDGEIRPVVRRIDTLDDGSALSGAAARIAGLGDVALAIPVGVPHDLSSFRDAMLVDPGDPVRPRWTTVDDVYYPRDFDTFALTSLYHHLERAAVFYADAGAPVDRPLDVHYLAKLVIPGLEDVPLEDNALYFFGVRFIVVTSFDQLQDVPLGMNRGVIVHEVGHAVFDQLVYDDEARLHLLDGSIDDRAANLLRATTEGLSDFFGAAETGDPRFLDASVPSRFLASSRALDEPAVYTESLRDGADTSTALFDPYASGTCLATALWRVPVDHAALAAGLVEAQRTLGQRLLEEPPWDGAPEDFGFAWLLDPLVRSLDELDRVAACTIFFEQLPAAADFIDACDPYRCTRNCT